jgi:lysylphosphatidylglycerol synthetase-like protein (DUF2156 family)
MNLDRRFQDTDTTKHKYWSWLTNINAKQAEILLSFAKDAFEQEVRRGERIDTKGNWLLAASFAALSLAAIVAKPAVDGLNRDLHLIIGIGLVIVIVGLLCAMSAILPLPTALLVHVARLTADKGLINQKRADESSIFLPYFGLDLPASTDCVWRAIIRSSLVGMTRTAHLLSIVLMVSALERLRC